MNDERTAKRPPKLPIIEIDLPVMFEDEGQEEMGETAPHSDAINILFNGLTNHLAGRPTHQVFQDMNLYYHPRKPLPYVTPDVMVVTPPVALPRTLRSYRLGVQGPAPVLAVEVLSERSAQQQDTTNKPRLYARLGVAEYLLVDVTGEYLSQRLLLKRRRGPRSWTDLTDPDGGVTSVLGFRVVLEPDGQVRVLDAASGHRYLRPDEAEKAARREAAAEARIRELETEIARLRGQLPPQE